MPSDFTGLENWKWILSSSSPTSSLISEFLQAHLCLKPPRWWGSYHLTLCPWTARTVRKPFLTLDQQLSPWGFSSLTRGSSLVLNRKQTQYLLLGSCFAQAQDWEVLGASGRSSCSRVAFTFWPEAHAWGEAQGCSAGWRQRGERGRGCPWGLPCSVAGAYDFLLVFLIFSPT